MTDYKDICLELMANERNIYEPAKLFEQNRIEVCDFLGDLITPETKLPLELIENNTLINKTTGETYSIDKKVVNLLNLAGVDKDWAKLNEQFLNYHKSLTVYTLLNSAAVVNYIAEVTGLHTVKNAKIVDVGAGTGIVASTFFDHPESNTYFLLDPNLRLLHDQFVRIYPKVLRNKIAHILCKAENLPLKNEMADLVLSLSSIDHFEDYPKFFQEAFRILKPGGKILISSHLDGDGTGQKDISKIQKILSPTIWERIARYFYYKKAKVGGDDHTYHFYDTVELKSNLEKAGFTTVLDHKFNNNFILVAEKKRNNV